MVTIRARRKGSRTYYYLEHSIREGKKVVKHEKYLGRKLPEDVEHIKSEFVTEIYRNKWFQDFERIKKGYEEQQRLMSPTALKKELEAFSIGFTYNTNRIEGSTLTLRQTAQLLEHGIAPGNKPIGDIKEAEAHMEVFLEMLESKKEISYNLLLYVHRRLFENTKKDIAGQLRKHQVQISGSKFMPPLAIDVYPLLMEFMGWYRDSDKNPVELAALVHLRLVTIHPFTDGNGRTSRLLMNMVLNKHGYPMLDIPCEKRAGYYTALERSQLKQDDGIFLQWFFKRYMKENGNYMGGRMR